MGESWVGRPPSREPCRHEWTPAPPEMKMYSLAVTPNGHLEGRGSLPPPVIMRTAATPMPTPKSSPNLDTAHSLLDSRRGSSSSVDPQLGDQKSLVGTDPCPSLRAPSGSLCPAPSPKMSEGPAPRPRHCLLGALPLGFGVCNGAGVAVLVGGA